MSTPSTPQQGEQPVQPNPPQVPPAPAPSAPQQSTQVQQTQPHWGQAGHGQQPAPGAYQAQSAPYAQTAYSPQPAAPVRSNLPTTMAATNAFAVVSVILAFVSPIAGIVFGHIALGQIKRNGDSGRGLALTGLILGYVYVAFIALFLLFYVSMIFIMIGSLGAAFSELNTSGYEFSS